MTSIKLLQKKHNYTPHEGEGDDACSSCDYYTKEQGYNICELRLDEAEDGGAVYLPNDYGVCDEYD